MEDFTKKIKGKLMEKIEKIQETNIDIYRYLFYGIIILTLFPVICICIMSVQTIKGLQTSIEPVITTQTVYLDNVTCTTRVEGTYIFGCGSVHETKYYEAYAIKEDGRKEPFSLNTNEIVVYETLLPGEQPYAEIDKKGAFTVETRLYLSTENNQGHSD